MKEQPDPCPFVGVKCREVQTQTRTKTSVEWRRRCLECGREIIITEFNYTSVPQQDARLAKHKVDPAQLVERWVRTEKTMKEIRRAVEKREKPRNHKPERPRNGPVRLPPKAGSGRKSEPGA